ncbi:Localization factor PodJL [Thalassocella blandensis]|nr:Localization factor PodJL [Thalassocella blandensis]
MNTQTNQSNVKSNVNWRSKSPSSNQKVGRLKGASSKKFACVAMAVLLTACGDVKKQDFATAGEQAGKSVEELKIVDCLLPGKVKKLGGVTYMSDRKAVRTTASDCNIRGGEYTAYDRADYKTALAVWLESAEKGDPEAQTYVGEIFEKGLGQEVDYVSAASWYEKAAKQGFKRAQINLGYLYENGLGVAQDSAKALNLYRVASGAEGELIFAADAQEEIDKLRKQLEQQVSSAKQESQYLSQQIASLQTTIDNSATTAAPQSGGVKPSDTKLNDAIKQIELLKNMYSRSQAELQELSGKMDSLPKIRYRTAAEIDLIRPVKLSEKDARTFKDINFGRYFALIIGNEDYLYLEDLSSPHKDALRMKQILEQQYGFSAVLLSDASEKEILNAFDDLYEQIGPNDNLLVFYAGHGNLTESDNQKRKRGYWLPSNAAPDGLVNWISNSIISDHLDRIRARSVLVIADSCFAGNLASERSSFLLGGMYADLSEASIKQGISRRSRIVISSGGERPVLDGIAGDHSIFANSLIKVLESNESVLRDNMLFAQLAVNVRQNAQELNVEQTPEMRPIRAAGHEGGDFYFIPSSMSTAELKQKVQSLKVAQNDF